MRCPDCNSEMATHRVSGVSVLQCDRCPSIWVGAVEREALWRARSDDPAQEFLRFVPGRSASAVGCPDCQDGRLVAGTLGGREVRCCSRCRGILASFKRPSGVDDEVAAWRKVVAGVLELLC